ncbi:hypothetical protein [Mycolicibacter algericus]|uniref:Uncharacterized protein n=2 Tax=Mycolicibacter algericus TaxID=1288388 RepID=A0A7I9Y406_MYCAL|nr:hypothetical protein [Mycolicibacter algericus]OQZ96916.1 hypothetical protein BST10_10085 [Mycolicibacter algericus DSM 45454]GFG83388.1 hypothetical protein MALGJ_00640 [Mycolicibacter algericus]
MTVELLDEEAPDETDFVICWLAPLLRAGTIRDSADEFPFAAVQRVAGGDDPDECLDEPVVQVDILAEGVQAAKLIARQVDRRMKLLGRKQPDVIMSDGRIANADYFLTLQKPIPMPYKNELVERLVARYQLGLSYATA